MYSRIGGEQGVVLFGFRLYCILQSCHGNDKFVVDIKIKEGSLLDHLNTMSGVRVSFLLEVESNTASFSSKAERCFEANLAYCGSQAKNLIIRTLVNGKITASNTFQIPAIVDVQKNMEE